jgi:hypothetical protein
MARPDLRASFLDQVASIFAERLTFHLNGKAATGTRGRGGPSPRKGKKLDMHCRYPGCPNRSKGPKFHFLCADHLTNPGWRKAKAAIEKAG